MLEKQISELQAATLVRIGAARSPEDLESVRVDVLGRKGVLALISKDMGKLATEERSRKSHSCRAEQIFGAEDGRAPGRGMDRRHLARAGAASWQPASHHADP